MQISPEGREFEAGLRHLKTRKLSVKSVINWYFFESGKDKRDRLRLLQLCPR